MKTRTKALLLVMSALLLVVSTVFATMAYLTSKTEVVKNTFTVGNVEIKLDEADVDEYGVDKGTRSANGNEYKLLPGHTYLKDPTVTVIEKSEQCYVRMQVSVKWKDNVDSTEKAIDVLKAAMPADWTTAEGVFLLQNLVAGWDNTIWISTEEVTSDIHGNAVYEFWYNDVVDAREGEVKLEPLFTDIVIPGDIDNETLATLNNIQIDVVAHAIQADGFNTAGLAWGSWPEN